MPPPHIPDTPTAGVWRVHLDAPGQRRGPVPSAVRTRHGAVEQGQSGGCVGTTSRGKGKGGVGGGEVPGRSLDASVTLPFIPRSAPPPPGP